jgi:hypothetical protein
MDQFALYFYIIRKQIVKLKYKTMKTFYRISSKEIGTVLLKRRKIAKALRWWLRENGFVYKYMFFVN